MLSSFYTIKFNKDKMREYFVILLKHLTKSQIHIYFAIENNIIDSIDIN